ncbi:hypothetical protein [Chitinilyticum litopenaei]|uniref:hypothetical protein n=1 Tax=Chitinilyticum litopenaei TaxID=1121276 RepID=UPI0005BE1B23|nr:hypothetical protein [Chitinilyticum litopenaei]
MSGWGQGLLGALVGGGRFVADGAEKEIQHRNVLELQDKRHEQDTFLTRLRAELQGQENDKQRGWQVEDRDLNNQRQDARFAVQDEQWGKGFQLQQDQFSHRKNVDQRQLDMEGARLALARSAQARANADANDPLQRQLKAAAQAQQANLMGYAVELDPKTRSVQAVKLSPHEQDAVSKALANPSDQNLRYLQTEPRAFQVFNTQFKALQAQRAESAAKQRPDDIAKAGLLSQVGNNYGAYFKQVQGLE